jgi:two-component system, NarL family, nitrate/nitrite response regulator NarL
MAPTNLLLLDDHALFRVTLGRLLGTDSSFRVIGDCSSIPEALSILAGKHVDLVLLDYELGQGETGLQFIRQARGAGYTGRIFIVTAGMTDSECVSALEHGVCGIFLKHSEPDLLIEAIGKVMVGQTWIDSRCIQALVKGRTNDRRNTHPDDLTIRERQVLEGVFGGLSNRQIAAECDISEALVSRYFKSSLSKLVCIRAVSWYVLLWRSTGAHGASGPQASSPSGSPAACSAVHRYDRLGRRR